MSDLQAPPYSGFLPWFLYDLDNFQLITANTVPGPIRDSKEVVLAETPIFGLNYQPIIPGGGGNRKIEFTLPLVRRNNTVGNVLLLKQIDLLRNRSAGFFSIRSRQFSALPRVLYFWGTGSVPLVWRVKRADATHREQWVNQLGAPQYSEIEFELWLDETHPLYVAEELHRQVSALFGQAISAYELIQSVVSR